VTGANATGWVLIAASNESPDSLWDLLLEFGERTGTDGPTVHALSSGDKRYCVHPDSSPDVEFRDDSLHQALLLAAMWKARQMPDEIWRRD
jgi:hypothetical protein